MCVQLIFLSVFCFEQYNFKLFPTVTNKILAKLYYRGGIFLVDHRAWIEEK